MAAINPYGTTRVPAAKTQGQIEAMLRKYGHGTSRWTNYTAEDARAMLGHTVDGPVIQLEFNAIVERDDGPVGGIGVRILAPVPDEKQRNQRMRCLYWWIKAKLESVAFGFKSFEQEFLPFIVVPGRDATVFELMGGDHVTGDLAKLDGSNVLKALPKG